MKALRWLTVTALLVSCTATPVQAPAPTTAPPSAAREALPLAPEIATGTQAKRGWTFKRHAVATANPLATAAGVRMLRAGGSAVDAAIAAQLVLNLVEPQSSGIGGGGFLMHWDGRTVQAFDGRETAPATATENLFLQPDGRPLPYAQAVSSGLSVGVPGLLPMLEAAHRLHGRLPWAQLVAPALEVAQNGFAISPRMHQSLQADASLRQSANAAAYFYDPQGQALPVGHVLRNPAMAALLGRIAREGSSALQTGAAAQDLVQRVRSHARPGSLGLIDLAQYRPVQREALCTDWQRWRLCGMPPPSSGTLLVGQVLGLLQRQAPVQALQAAEPTPDWLHLYMEATRLAQADRDQFVADPTFTEAPAGRWTSLLDAAYLDQRASLITPKAANQVLPGQPQGAKLAFAPHAVQPEAGTTHLSVIDDQGHTVALTSSIEAAFGSRILADGGTGLPGGYLLNNQLTDFAFQPRDAAGRTVANRVQPGKRPRSSMTPLLVFDRANGQLVMALGSPGGSAIPHYTAKTLLGVLSWGLDAQRAIDLPNFLHFGSTAVLETGRINAATANALRSRGHTVREAELTSGLQVLHRRATDIDGGADPRREGTVAGD